MLTWAHCTICLMRRVRLHDRILISLVDYLRSSVGVIWDMQISNDSDTRHLNQFRSVE